MTALRAFLTSAVLAFVTLAGARADVGGSVRDELAYVQSTMPFRGVAVDNGPIAGGLQRWKLSTAPGDQQMFAIDGVSRSGRVVREYYIRMTQSDPFSLMPGASEGQHDLASVLTQREYRDFTNAAAVARVDERPARTIAHFFRGRYAAYEVLEPATRIRGGEDRFEWRSFPVSELTHAIVRAKACDNGDDCAAFPFAPQG